MVTQVQVHQGITDDENIKEKLKQNIFQGNPIFPEVTKNDKGTNQSEKRNPLRKSDRKAKFNFLMYLWFGGNKITPPANG